MSDKTPKSSNKPEEQNAIHGLVADILNEREVVLNIGKRHGVKPEMRFAILDDPNYEIKDPKTGEVLDKLPPREKIRVEVVELTDNIAIARTFETVTINIGGVGFAPATLRLFEPSRYVERPVTFRISEGSTFYNFQKLSPEESVVKIGDSVRQVIHE